MSKKKAAQTDYAKMMENVPEGLGLEEVSLEDVKRSRLAIVQKGSPQIDEDEDSYIEGAKIGQILDTALSQVYDPPVRFVVVDYRRRWYEWKDGGSLVQIHDSEPPHDRQFKRPNGNKVSLTAVYTGFFLEPNSNERRIAFVALSSTQLRKAKDWTTLLNHDRLPNGMKAPAFWNVWELSSKKEFHQKGNFMGWVIRRGGTIEEYAAEIGEDLSQIIQECVDTNELVKKEFNRYLMRSGNVETAGQLRPAEEAFTEEEF